MSLLNKEDRLSVEPFASVPALWDLPEIERGPASVSEGSSQGDGDVSHHSFKLRDFNLEEGCLITKSMKYTHQLVHLVNPVHAGDPEAIEYIIEVELSVIPYADFSLNHACNLIFLEEFVSTSLDVYAFIALSPSSSTVDALLNMVKSDNDRQQQVIDETGLTQGRNLDFDDSSFTNPEYELIALHPEHFLPRGAVLPIYVPSTQSYKTYVASGDRRLRESFDSDSPRLPPFRHEFQNRPHFTYVNIFLVAINADIKFRRYFKMIEHYPSMTALPADVMALMNQVTELVNLLYWQPKPAKDSEGYHIQAAKAVMRRRAGWGELTKPRRIRHVLPRDFATRRAYASELMSGPSTLSLCLSSLQSKFIYLEIDWDPSDPKSFEEAFPRDTVEAFYAEHSNIERWSQDSSSEV